MGGGAKFVIEDRLVDIVPTGGVEVMNCARLAVAMLLAYSNAALAFAGEPGNTIGCRVSEQSPSQKLVSFDAGPWQEYSKSGKTIPTPTDGVDVAKHDTYKEFRELPFAKLITVKNQQPTTKLTHARPH